MALPLNTVLQALLPLRKKLTSKRSWAVVQPVVLECFALCARLDGEGTGGLRNFLRDFWVENVTVLRHARHNAKQIKRSPADHYGLKMKTAFGTGQTRPGFRGST